MSSDRPRPAELFLGAAGSTQRGENAASARFGDIGKSTPISSAWQIHSYDLVNALCRGRIMSWNYSEQNRKGDHISWISDYHKFRSHYQNWQPRYSLEVIIEGIYQDIRGRSDFAASNSRSDRKTLAKRLLGAVVV
jgi:hypothetical protein